MNKNNLTRLEKLHRLKYKIEKEIRLLEEKAIDGNQVVSYAARWFRVPFLELISDSRKEDLVLVRTIVAYELRKRGYTFNAIGDLMNRDHSTVIYMLNNYRNQYGETTFESFTSHAEVFAHDLEEHEDRLYREKNIVKATGKMLGKTDYKIRSYE